MVTRPNRLVRTAVVKPIGFPFANSRVRHGFGYRDCAAPGTFGADKARVESAFRAGLERGCAVHSGAEKTAATRRAVPATRPSSSSAARQRPTLRNTPGGRPGEGRQGLGAGVPLFGVFGRAMSQRYAWATRQYTE
ncbi:phospholipase A2 [Streptomyces sp. NPDC002205]|uniref:phospholipase A2 n=1 Tax=Streptomyces sp. NPDC002205 TaxID=3154411 RepID=UPI0033225969